jgi:hypothetical protein
LAVSAHRYGPPAVIGAPPPGSSRNDPETRPLRRRRRSATDGVTTWRSPRRSTSSPRRRAGRHVRHHSALQTTALAQARARGPTSQPRRQGTALTRAPGRAIRRGTDAAPLQSKMPWRARSRPLSITDSTPRGGDGPAAGPSAADGCGRRVHGGALVFRAPRPRVQITLLFFAIVVSYACSTSAATSFHRGRRSSRMPTSRRRRRMAA